MLQVIYSFLVPEGRYRLDCKSYLRQNNNYLYQLTELESLPIANTYFLYAILENPQSK